jgi:hypothetical protein
MTISSFYDIVGIVKKTGQECPERENDVRSYLFEKS